MKNFIKVSLLVFAFSSCSTQKRFISSDVKPTLIANTFSFTEGPAANSDGDVFFTDQPNDKIYEWKWKTNNISQFLDNAHRANGTYFDSKGNLLTCSDENGEILEFNADKNKTVLLTGFKGKRLNGPNDLWVYNDSIYFTDPLYKRDYWKNFKQAILKENVYLRKPNGETIIVDSTLQKPNGIIGDSKNQNLFVADIVGGKTYKYKIKKDGTLFNKTMFCNMGSDGMTIDKNRNIYLTGNGVTVFNKNGLQIKHISIPEKWTSNVTFGGKNFSTLFITASESVYMLPTRMKGL